MGKYDVVPLGSSLNFLTSFVNKPCKNLIVSGPLNRITERDFKRETRGPVLVLFKVW